MTQPIIFQRTEAAALFVSALYFYLHLHFPLLWFAILLFSIDIVMLGYLHSKQLGAMIYNFGHSAAIPSILILVGNVYTSRILIGLGLIWLAHIGLDRALGYGLKFADGFKRTHLGDIGFKD